MPVQSSIFQSISVIGYCMLPLTLLGFIVSLISGKAPAVEPGVQDLGAARVDEASATSLSGTA